MRKVFSHIILGLVIAVLASSCVTLQPTASRISNPDYNQRVEISNPQFKKKHSILGITFDVSMPIAGAVGGYFLDPFVWQTSSGQKSMPAGGAVLGAIVGTGLTYANHAISKYGSSSTARNRQAWVDKAYGYDYTILESSGDFLRIINDDAESAFTVKTLSDARDFAYAFPNSLYSEQVVSQSISKLGRDDLPEVLQLFPQTIHAQELKDRYINESRTYKDLVSALKMYPKPDSEVENLFVNLVRTPLDGVDFHQRYPSSSNAKQVVINAFRTSSKPEDVRALANAYGPVFNLSQSDLSKASDGIKKNYYIGLRDMTNYANMKQLDSFNEKYSWLTFKNKRREIVSKAWALADRLYPKGKDVIAQAGSIVGKAYAKKVGLDGGYFNGFVNDMLKQQFTNVKVLSTKTLSSTSEDFERWKKATYTAGVVKTSGNLQFLVYGEVKNESKFDFPVSMRVHSNVVQVQKIESENIGGMVLNVLGALTGAPTQHTELLGSLSSKEFIIPCAISGQTMPYAILIEFEDKVFNGYSAGMNVLDLVKVSSQIKLQDVNVKVEMNDKNATDQQLKEQNEWLKMAINGLPDAKIIDWWRNKEYKQETWDAEWSRILRESKNRTYSSNSTSRDRDEDNDDDDEEDDSDDDREQQKEAPIDIESIGMPEYEWTSDWKSSSITPHLDETIGIKESDNWFSRDIRFADSEVGKAWIGRSPDHKVYTITSGTEYNSLDNAIIAQYVFFKYGKKRETGRVW